MEVTLKAVHFFQSDYGAASYCPIARAIMEQTGNPFVIVSVTNVSISMNAYTMENPYTAALYKEDYKSAETVSFDTSVIRTVILLPYSTRRKKKGM